MEGLSGTFSPQKVRHFHWKPPLFSARRQAARGPATDPHGLPARNPAVSLCYFGFHWLEFLLGSHLRLRPVTFRGGLVLIDRYYYDFFVDQRRYRLARAAIHRPPRTFLPEEARSGRAARCAGGSAAEPEAGSPPGGNRTPAHGVPGTGPRAAAMAACGCHPAARKRSAPTSTAPSWISWRERTRQTLGRPDTE